jgi:integrase
MGIVYLKEVVPSGRNIKYQFLTAINKHFEEGMDKHALKRAGDMDGTRVFSYADRSGLVDLASSFSNYMKENHADIKEIRSITTDHVQGFLNSKCATTSQKTLDQYASKFRKLEKLVNDTYKSCHVDFHGIAVPPSEKNGGGKVRNQMLAHKDYQTMLNRTTNENLVRGLLLSYSCGLRASEVCKLKGSDINTQTNTIHIVDSKGKRSRDVKIPQQYQKEVQALASIDGRVCPVQHESLQKAFRRELQRNGLAEQYPNGAFHLCRKAYATQLYQECRGSGMDIQQSLSKVSVALGHGEKRNALMREYICVPIE